MTNYDVKLRRKMKFELGKWTERIKSDYGNTHHD